MIQGTEEWFRARLGKVTASRICDVIAKTKTGWGASRANYAAQLVAERLTRSLADSYTNKAMQHGIECEPDAANAYAFRTDAEVEPVGFIEHPRIDMSGASPDGLVGADGLVEIKCPNTATHIDTLLIGRVPDKYVAQMQWQMACTGRAWCDFVSFDPRMPPEMRLFIKRVERDDARIAELERLVEEFLVEVADKVAGLTRLYGLTPPPTPQRRWEDIPAPLRAGIRCGESEFRAFLGAHNPDHAAELVRTICRVESRKDLATDAEAGARWETLEAEYWAWVRDPRASPRRDEPQAEREAEREAEGVA